MTTHEHQLISATRIMVVGSGAFISHITPLLRDIGFSDLQLISGDAESSAADGDTVTIIVRFFTDTSATSPSAIVPVICSFDFIGGAAAIVILPGDDRNLISRQRPRLWAARYIAGYCAFWNMEGCGWLYNALPLIEEGRHSIAAQKTAALLCARIAANIAVGRPVKHFPRFYLTPNPAG